MPLCSRTAAVVASLGLVTLALCAQAQAPVAKPDSAGGSAAEACERAARQALAGKGLRPAEVTFAGAPSLQPSFSSDSLIVLRGIARWRGDGTDVHSISYSCNVDPRTSEMVGLVMRDTTPVAVAAAPAPAPVEPDLSALSPGACESGAAEALKRHWPRVSQISFDPGTRTFQQQSTSKAEFHGSGRAVPAPSAPATFFGFDCEIDPRDGRVLRTSVSW